MVTMTLFIGTGAVLLLFRLPDPQGDPWAGSDQDPLVRGIWLALYLVMLIVVAPHWREVLALMRGNIWIPAMLMLVVLSAAWSAVPALTFRRGVAIDLGAIYGYYLAVRFTTKQVVDLLAIVLAVALLLSLVFVIFLPSYGVYQDIFRGSTWRGVFIQKNPLGRNAALGIVVFLVLRQYHHRRLVAVSLTVLAGVLIVGSASTTALIAALVCALLALGVPVIRRLGGQTAFGLAAVIISVAIGIAAFGLGITGAKVQHGALSALGKDSTLTDRTSVWDAVPPEIAKKPLLGYGVSGFWRGWSGPGSSDVWRQISWHPAHSHNGYLDLTLALGFVGLGIFALGLLTISTQTARLGFRQWRPDTAWPLLFLPFLLVESAAENVLVQPNSIYWILYVFTAASVGRQSSARRDAEQHVAH